jgi:hypothetical protein
MSVNPQHRFEAHFPSEIHDIANETQPIILVDIRSMAIYKSRLTALVSARKYLGSHLACSAFCFLRIALNFVWVGSLAAELPLR